MITEKNSERPVLYKQDLSIAIILINSFGYRIMKAVEVNKARSNNDSINTDSLLVRE